MVGGRRGRRRRRWPGGGGGKGTGGGYRCGGTVCRQMCRPLWRRVSRRLLPTSLPTLFAPPLAFFPLSVSVHNSLSLRVVAAETRCERQGTTTALLLRLRPVSHPPPPPPLRSRPTLALNSTSFAVYNLLLHLPSLTAPPPVNPRTPAVAPSVPRGLLRGRQAVRWWWCNTPRLLPRLLRRRQDRGGRRTEEARDQGGYDGGGTTTTTAAASTLVARGGRQAGGGGGGGGVGRSVEEEGFEAGGVSCKGGERWRRVVRRRCC